MDANPPAEHPARSQAPAPGTIAVCIVCRNEADKLQPCLESIRWVDELLVMDLESTDGTLELVQSYGARVVRREPYPIVEPLRNELAALASSDWILAMDPDERVTPGLAEELRRRAQQPDLDAIYIPFTNYDLGYPPSQPMHRYESHLRMYRPARVMWPDFPNAQPVVADGRKYIIPNDDRLVMIHDRSRNVPEILDRVIRYAPMQGQAMFEEGQVFTARAMLAAMAQVFDKQFIVGRPWDDGVPGILRAGILTAFKFYVWAAFWQAAGGQRTDADDRFVRRWGSLFHWLALAARRIVRLVLAVGRWFGR